MTGSLFADVREGLPTFGLDTEFPILWDLAQKFDHDERLGYGTSPTMAEADAALRELWMARREAEGNRG